MNKTIERKIKKIYEKIFKEVFNQNGIKDLVEGNSDRVMEKIVSFSGSEQYDNFCKRFSEELSKEGLNYQRGLWRKYFQAARAAHHIALPNSFKEFETQQLKLLVQENFKMIKSIPEYLTEIVNHKYTEDLIDEVIKGSRSRGSFKRELAKHGVKRAGVIARTEAAKLQTTILENRSTSLGSVVYEWMSSNDRRTRPSHRQMNTVIVFWKQPKPHLDNMYGHAGEFPNCRCTPQPILDEDDLTESRYKVYNYKNDSFLIMTRNELIQAIKDGGIDNINIKRK